MLEGEQGDFGSLTVALFVGSCVRGAPPFFFPPPSFPLNPAHFRTWEIIYRIPFEQVPGFSKHLYDPGVHIIPIPNPQD